MLVKKNNVDCQEEMWNEKKRVSCVLLTFLPTLQHRHVTSSFDPVIITAAARGLCRSNKKTPTFFTYCVLGRLLRQPALSFFLAGHSANVLSRSGQQRVMIWGEKIIKGSMCKMLRVGRSVRPAATTIDYFTHCTFNKQLLNTFFMAIINWCANCLFLITSSHVG